MANQHMELSDDCCGSRDGEHGTFCRGRERESMSENARKPCLQLLEDPPLPQITKKESGFIGWIESERQNHSHLVSTEQGCLL